MVSRSIGEQLSVRIIRAKTHESHQLLRGAKDNVAYQQGSSCPVYVKASQIPVRRTDLTKHAHPSARLPLSNFTGES